MPNRYDGSDIINNVRKVSPNGSEKNVSRLSIPFYPSFNDNEDVYIVSQMGDRLDSIAFEYYGDISYWFVLAAANNLGRGTMAIPPGLVIRIPYYNATTGIGALFEQYNFER